MTDNVSVYCTSDYQSINPKLTAKFIPNLTKNYLVWAHKNAAGVKCYSKSDSEKMNYIEGDIL